MYDILWYYLHGWNGNRKKMVVALQKQAIVEREKGT
jgi:hypothetical protein